jgi:hypothetical protein
MPEGSIKLALEMHIEHKNGIEGLFNESFQRIQQRDAYLEFDRIALHHKLALAMCHHSRCTLRLQNKPWLVG